MDDKRIYRSCDSAIQAMNRLNVELFGRLKLAKWDEIHLIRTVTSVFSESASKARKRYLKVATDAYILAMGMCGVARKKAIQMAEKAITMDWVDEILHQTDFITLYRFDSEAERKAQRLAETLEATDDKDFEINKALRSWSQQLGQYAINFTDYAMIQAFEDAGVLIVQWITQRDGRVCPECKVLNGQIFKIDEAPRKPHWNCRCYLKAVLDGETRLK